MKKKLQKNLVFSNASLLSFLLLLSSSTFSENLSGKETLLNQNLSKAKKLSQITVKGTVTDEKGETLIGVSVVIKGTKSGTTTNVSGIYQISAPDANSILVFSYLGFTTKEVAVNNQSRIDVVLQEDTKTLSEVVVIGYGEVQRSDVTGAISSFKPKEVDATQFGTPDALIRGRVPGVSVLSQSNQPGGILSVKIRGTNSLRSDNEPLYVVDGVIINSATEDVRNPTSGAVALDGITQQNGLTALNSLDIESVEILKDASATAIYGSRGANGVVIITTKKGKAGKATINFTSNVQFSRTSKYLDVLDAVGFAKYRNELNGGIPLFNSDTLQSINWQKDVQGTDVSQTHRLSASGGSADGQTKYFIAGGYQNTEGIVLKTGSKKGDFKFNLTQRLNDRLSLDFGLTAAYIHLVSTTSTEAQALATTSLVGRMLAANPFVSDNFDFNDPEAEFVGPRNFINGYDDFSTEKRYLGNLALNYKISNLFSYKLNLAGDYRNKVRTRYFGTSTFAGRSINGLAGVADLDRSYYLIENLLFFNKIFKSNHKINGTFGVTYDNTLFQDGTGANANFFDQSLRGDAYGTGQILYPSSYNKALTELFSVLARVNYSYKGRYILTLSGRADGSSKFADGNRFSYFPAASAAWLISNEKFMEALTPVSNLKLRVGYGATGNQSINAYSTLAIFNSVENYNYVSGNSQITGTGPANISNKGLIWETTTSSNAGIDFGFFNNKITGSVDAYYKQTKNLLQNFPLPQSSGFASYPVNRGSLENKGIEFGINAFPITKKDLDISVGINMSFNRNKITDLALPSSNLNGKLEEFYIGQGLSNSGQFVNTPVNIFVVGQPLGLFYGYKTNGIYQNAAETAGQSINGVIPRPGDYRIVDTNGDKIATGDDRVILGNPNPKFTFGANSSITYKGISLAVFIDGSYGNQLVNATEARIGNLSNPNNVLSEYYYNAWSPTNPTNLYPRVGYNYTIFIDRHVENASFLRLSTLSLGYNLPIEKSKFAKSISFNVTGRNIALLTKYRGFDPEVNSFGFNSGKIGVDLNSYPNSRGLTFGLNVSF